ncbi:MAG: hypothetical protein WAZ77_16580 [Candidatus Nitrosopolaris sp.]
MNIQSSQNTHLGKTVQAKSIRYLVDIIPNTINTIAERTEVYAGICVCSLATLATLEVISFVSAT